jgi:hypothetical protein
LKAISQPKVAVTLFGLAVLAVAIHGYHPYAEDAEIYLPGVEKLLQPALFPVGTASFEAYSSASLFPRMIAFSVQLAHLPLPYTLFASHLISIFLLLLGCWQLAGKCFEDVRARFGAVLLVAVLLTLPVAGTALYLMDQYVNPRNFAGFAAVFAIARTLEGKYWRAAAWLAFAAAMHPLMATFAISFCLLEPALRKKQIPVLAYALLPLPKLLEPTSPAYHAAAQFHGFHYISNWHWYEVLGIIGPLPILWWFSRIAQSTERHDMAAMCRTLAIYDVIYFVAALIVSVPGRFEVLARIQPLRSLYLLYLLLVVFGGGLLAEHLLKTKLWRWIALFAPLAAVMFIAQRSLFPASAHVELPWAAPRNEWAQAFLWIRQNTTLDSRFAIDPDYMQIRGEDAIGFRALAERSRLADAIKDSGSVSMFPSLAQTWYEQWQAQKGWKDFDRAKFLQLRQMYGISWLVLEPFQTSGLACPYRNAAVAVCQIGN